MNVELYRDELKHTYTVERNEEELKITDETGRFFEKHSLTLELQEIWLKARGLKCISHQMNLFEVQS